MQIFENHIIRSYLFVSIRSWCELRLKFSLGEEEEGGGRGEVNRALLEKLAFAFFAIKRRWNSWLGRLSSFDPLFHCAQCQEVSRPEFTLTHSIRSFVRSAKRFVRSTEDRAGFATIFIPSLRVIRSPFYVSFL